MQFLAQLSQALKRVKLLSEAHPFIYVALWIVPIASTAIWIEWKFYEATGRQIVSQADFQKIQNLQQVRTDLQAQLESARTELKRQMDLSQSQLEMMRKQLEEERRLSVAQLETARQLAELRLAALRREFNERATTDHQLAAMTEKELQSKLRAEQETLRALQQSFPSLESRGLWDRGSPSPRAILLAVELSEPVRSQAHNALTSAVTPREKKAQVVELLAARKEKAQDCDRRRADVARVEAEYKAQQGRIQSQPLRSGESRGWSSQELAPVEAANAYFMKCSNELDALFAQVAAATR